MGLYLQFTTLVWFTNAGKPSPCILALTFILQPDSVSSLLKFSVQLTMYHCANHNSGTFLYLPGIVWVWINVQVTQVDFLWPYCLQSYGWIRSSNTFSMSPDINKKAICIMKETSRKITWFHSLTIEIRAQTISSEKKIQAKGSQMTCLGSPD